MQEQLDLPNVPQLIDCRRSEMTDLALQRFVIKQLSLNCPIFTLRLSCNYITQVGIGYLSQCKWTHLTILHLQGNKIGQAGCKIITKTVLPQLKQLRLNNNEIGDIGVTHLAKAGFKSLELLEIQYNYVLGECFRALNHADWKNMKKVSIWYNKYRSNEFLRFLPTWAQARDFKSFSTSSAYKNT